jgi:hypothetical protein
VRAHLFSFAIVAASIVAGACAGPAAGKSSFESGDVQEESGGSKAADDDDDTAKSSSSSSGAPAGDQVFGTSTFAYKNPGQNADDHAATHTGKTPLEGKDCVVAGCHLDTKPWAFAGTVYTKADATTTVAEAEVGIVYADNSVKSAMTDAQGNFWFVGTDFPPASAKIGVRKAGSATKFMATPLPAAPAGRACNSTACHGAAANRIWIQ